VNAAGTPPSRRGKVPAASASQCRVPRFSCLQALKRKDSRQPIREELWTRSWPQGRREHRAHCEAGPAVREKRGPTLAFSPGQHGRPVVVALGPRPARPTCRRGPGPPASTADLSSGPWAPASTADLSSGPWAPASTTDLSSGPWAPASTTDLSSWPWGPSSHRLPQGIAYRALRGLPGPARSRRACPRPERRPRRSRAGHRRPPAWQSPVVQSPAVASRARTRMQHRSSPTRGRRRAHGGNTAYRPMRRRAGSNSGMRPHLGSAARRG
jgi:hypothetical protein